MSEEKAKLTRSDRGWASQRALSSAGEAQGWILGPRERRSQLGLQHGQTARRPPPREGMLSAPRDPTSHFHRSGFFFQLGFGRMNTGTSLGNAPGAWHWALTDCPLAEG